MTIERFTRALSSGLCSSAIKKEVVHMDLAFSKAVSCAAVKMESPVINAPSYARASSDALPDKNRRDAPRNAWQAIRKGLRGRCPNCGEGSMFRAYLKVNDTCPHCGEELFHQRADDAPPYVTIFVVGHIIGTFMILVEEFWPDAPIWLHAMVWPTITLILSLWFLPIIKGGLIAHQWALRMHGFETTGRAATQNK